jgi:sialic acid synthase SpsE
MSVFVIGEMASAHDGELRKAKQLVDVAVDAGCDAVKVQFWSNADRLADRRQVPQYYRDIYRKYQIPVEWLTILKNYCGNRIEFMATCFLPEDVKTVSPFVKRFKLSAFESYANDLLRKVFAIAGDRPVITSVNTLDHHLRDYGKLTEMRCARIMDDRDIDVLMYCVTAYPAALDSIDLNQLQDEANGEDVGFSDHTGDIDMGAYAVCAGATYVEAHMKLISTDGLNPDGGSFAHLPAALKQYVSNIRKAELVCSGDMEKPKLSKEEKAMRPYHVVTA